jgi:hypothetical protein
LQPYHGRFGCIEKEPLVPLLLIFYSALKTKN